MVCNKIYCLWYTPFYYKYFWPNKLADLWCIYKKVMAEYNWKYILSQFLHGCRWCWRDIFPCQVKELSLYCPRIWICKTDFEEVHPKMLIISLKTMRIDTVTVFNVFGVFIQKEHIREKWQSFCKPGCKEFFFYLSRLNPSCYSKEAISWTCCSCKKSVAVTDWAVCNETTVCYIFIYKM